MNNKAQAGPVGFIFLVIVFVIIWFLWLGSWLTDIGKLCIENGNLTGGEAFFFANLNLVVFIGLILGILAYMYFAGGNQ